MNGPVGITANGIQVAERIITDRERQGLPLYAGVVAYTDQELREHLESAIFVVRQELDQDADLAAETRDDVQSDLDSASDQLRASSPNRWVIKAAFDRIQRIWPAVAQVAALGAAVTEILHGLGV